MPLTCERYYFNVFMSGDLTGLCLYMSRRPTVLDTFSILDDRYNSNFLGVDVNGRAS